MEDIERSIRVKILVEILNVIQEAHYNGYLVQEWIDAKLKELGTPG